MLTIITLLYLLGVTLMMAGVMLIWEYLEAVQERDRDYAHRQRVLGDPNATLPSLPRFPGSVRRP